MVFVSEATGNTEGLYVMFGLVVAAIAEERMIANKGSEPSVPWEAHEVMWACKPLYQPRPPRLIPPFLAPINTEPDPEADCAIKEHLLEAKCMQAFYANRDHGQGDIFKVGDKVMLSTLHHQREFTANDPSHIAKFIPCFDGPYDIVNSMPEFSAYTLDLPNSPNIFPTFHSSQLKCFTTNDVSLFPSHEHTWPGPIMTPEGLEEYVIERILDKRHRGCGYQYLVRWVGHGPEEDHLLPWHELEECEALNIWINGGGGQG